MSYADENNPYRSFGYAPIAAEAEDDARISFIRRTYGHLGGAILAFAALETMFFMLVPQQVQINILQMLTGGWAWLLVIGGFMAVSWIARSWAESNASVPMQYAGLGLYVVAEAIIFMPLLLLATMVGENVIASAGVVTLVIFGGLTATVMLTKADFSFMRMYLMLAGFAAMGAVVCAVMFGLSLGIWFSLAMVVLASGYILYDTSNVLHHYRTNQHVAAALALFASVALLFYYVLRIMIALSGRD